MDEPEAHCLQTFTDAADAYRGHPGRDLRFGPDWACSDESLLFDANSGDYWVLSPLARRLMERLASGPALARCELVAPDDTSVREPTPEGVVEATLAGLVASGLVCRQGGGLASSPFTQDPLD